MFPLQRKVNTQQQFTNIRKGFKQQTPPWTGREQTEDTRYVMNKKNQANLCYTGDTSKRIAGSTRTANGRVCITNTNRNNTAALNNHIRQMWFTTLQQRSCVSQQDSATAHGALKCIHYFLRAEIWLWLKILLSERDVFFNEKSRDHNTVWHFKVSFRTVCTATTITYTLSSSMPHKNQIFD